MVENGWISEMIQSKIDVANKYEDFCEKVTQEILAFSDKKIAVQGQFQIVLTGGSTPKGIYQCMASSPYREKFQWDKMYFFWGDERWVSPEDQKSNYRMVSESLLTKVEIPSRNTHSIQTVNCDLQSSASLYEEVIRDFFKLKNGEFPRFDLILLGLGRDGHIASLFPGNPALLVKDRLVMAVSQKEITEDRITLTLPVINHAEMIFFLVSGYEKADIVHEVLEGENKNLPAKEIRPYRGELCWFLEKTAASRVSNVASLTRG